MNLSEIIVASLTVLLLIQIVTYQLNINSMKKKVTLAVTELQKAIEDYLNAKERITAKVKYKISKKS